MIFAKIISLIKSKISYLIAPSYVKILTGATAILTLMVCFENNREQMPEPYQRQNKIHIPKTVRSSLNTKLENMVRPYGLSIQRMRIIAQNQRSAIIYLHVVGQTSDEVVLLMKDINNHFSYKLKPIRFSTHENKRNHKIEARIWLETPLFF